MMSTQHQSVTAQEGLRLLYPERTRRVPSAAQWGQYQLLIKKLYVEEGRTLQEIMEIMKRDFDFNATAKMYKSRLKTWGYKKNIRLKHGEEEDLIQLLQESPQHPGHSRAQKGNLLLLNGQLIPQDRLVTYLRRRGQGVARIHKPPTIRSIKSPDAIYISEAMLFQVRSYIRGAWEETISTAEELDTLREKHPLSGECNSLAHGVRYALEQKKLNDALVLMRRAPKALADLIEQRPPNILYVFFMSLAYFTFGGPLKDTEEAAQLLVVVRYLIKYAAAFAAKDQGLPSSHPIRQMLSLLCNADEKDIHQLAQKAWLVNCQSWDGLMDRPRSTYAIASWISYGEFNGFDAMPSNLGTIIELTLDQNAAKYGEYQANGRDPYFNQEIIRVFEDLLRRGPHGLLRADALSWLAKASKARGERESAERYMRDLIEFLLEDAVYRNSLARGFMNDLETWFIEWGDTHKAAELAKWREEELGPVPTA